MKIADSRRRHLRYPN